MRLLENKRKYLIRILLGAVMLLVNLGVTPQGKTAAEAEKERVEVISVSVAGDCLPKIYDDSRKVSLQAEVRWPKGEVPDESWVCLEVRGYAKSADVGLWKVDVEYELTGPGTEYYTLECRRAALETRVEIVPKGLTVVISDARKPYLSDMDTDLLVFEKNALPVSVSGFMKDGEPTSDAPAGFVLPELTFEKGILTKESPRYRNGTLIRYQGALTISEDSVRNLSGKMVNYCYYPEDERYTRKGDVILTEPEQETDVSEDVRAEDAGQSENESRQVYGTGEDPVQEPERTTEVSEMTETETERVEETESESVSAVDEQAPVIVLDEKTADYIKTFWQQRGEALTLRIKDANILKNSRVLCIRDEVFEMLREGKDYQVIKEIQGDGSWQYTFTILQRVFEQEGRYAVSILTEDEAGNKTKEYGENIRFIVDRTPPICMVYTQKKKDGSVRIEVECEDDRRFGQIVFWKNGVKEKVVEEVRTQLEVSAAKGDDWSIEAVDAAGNTERIELDMELFVPEKRIPLSMIVILAGILPAVMGVIWKIRYWDR